MSARDWRAAREGDTQAAPKTTSRTPENFIVGIGASGTLLAGAAILFITLVGLASFKIWPSSRDLAPPVGGNVELSPATATPHGSAGSGSAGSASGASGLLASTVPISGGDASPAGGGAGVGGNG